MINITYHQWEKLTEKQQNDNILLGRLPDVPLAGLKNGLIMSRMIIRNGDLMLGSAKGG